jgi:sec-independent protein translocase protein TatC
MGFLEHLDELRTRLIRSCLALAAGMGLSVFFVDRIADLVVAPMLRTLPAGATLIYTKPGEGFAFHFDLALIGGVVLAAPFLTWQAWRFVAPGLYRAEKRLVAPFLALAIGGAIAGAIFSHTVLFPGLMTFFRAFDSPHIRFMPRIEDTFALYKNTLIGMVAVFQIPTLVFVLAKVGVVTARGMWRHFNYAVLVAVIAAAVLTPSPDPWNQLVFAAPMLAMYVIGIGIAWIVQPRVAPESEQRGAALKLVFAATVLEQARRSQPTTARRSARPIGLVRRE